MNLFGWLSKNTIDIYFSPKGGCAAAIAAKIATAKESIYIAAYVFTNELIYNQLIESKARIEIIVDGNGSKVKGSKVNDLIEKKLSVYIDHHHQIMHNKYMIIDGNWLITGSFNFTSNAENNNAENLLIINNAQLCEQYKNNWNIHLAHSSKLLQALITGEGEECLF
jgi:phosphatidylserine/phosphatidylglycerophosphate/cardiolipin synthase-like enzyme